MHLQQALFSTIWIATMHQVSENRRQSSHVKSTKRKKDADRTRTYHNLWLKWSSISMENKSNKLDFSSLEYLPPVFARVIMVLRPRRMRREPMQLNRNYERCWGDNPITSLICLRGRISKSSHLWCRKKKSIKQAQIHRNMHTATCDAE